MKRVNIQELQPKAYQALFGLEEYLSQSSIPAGLRELIRLRASQINGCTFCQNLHTNGAQDQGEKPLRIKELSNWRNSDLFDNKEKAALAVTEAVTLISKNGLPDEVYKQALRYFNEIQIAQLIVLIATINAWNRIGVSTKL